MTAAGVTPWWEALKIRGEILDSSGQIDDVQMSLFRAVHGAGGERPPYAEASYYGEITHPTDRLVDLLAEIAVRLGGGQDHRKARAVTRLDQGMGGGKSHACIGAFHLAHDPEGLLGTELGQAVAERTGAKVGRDLPTDLGNPHVVVLPCDNMTPGAPSRELEGPAVNLYERFLWRLFSKNYELYERFKPYWSDKSKIAEAMAAAGRPVLVIVDEVLDYVGNGLDGAGDPDLAAQDMGFLRALLDVVNDVPGAAMLVVMIASDRDKTALSIPAQARRDDLGALLERNGTPATVTEVGDFAEILRRRLFEGPPDPRVVSETSELYRSVLEDKGWTRSVWEATGQSWRARWDEQVASCYPFHPMLMAIAKEEWSKVTGFQRVRSTIRIFAATVHALGKRGEGGGWVPALIGPGDLPLSDSAVREALLGSGLVEDERTISNYRSLAEIEIVNNDETGGTARLQDLERTALAWGRENPRAAERAATFVFLASVVGTLRPGLGRGASAPEVKAATAVPGLSYTVTDADAVVEELVDRDRGMSALEVVPGQGNNKPARYFLSTRLTHRMLVRNIRRTITEEEREEAIADFAQRMANSGPFQLKFVKADPTRTPAEVLATAGLDAAYSKRLIILDSAQFTLRNGAEDETLLALKIAMGLGQGTDRLPVQWASSAVYAVANTQRRAMARGFAVEYLARRKALDAPEVQGDDDLKATGNRELSRAREQLEKAIRRAYQHVCYLGQPDIDRERSLEQFTFDDERSSAIDGTIVWKALAERDKVFDSGEFDAQALVHNLREPDYGKTLSDLRATFYRTPRMPLLYGDDADLRRAVYDAVAEGHLEVVRGGGEAVEVTAPNEVNLESAGLRLVKPRPKEEEKEESSEEEDPPGGPQPGEDPPQPKEQRVAFTLAANLLGNEGMSERFTELFRSLYVALDDRDISYVQGTLEVIVEPGTGEEVRQRLEEMGIRVSVKDL